MRKIDLLNVLTMGTALGSVIAGTPLLAADLASYNKSAPAPPPAWSGFYAGLNAGYGWGTSNSAQTTGIPLIDNISSDPLWGTPFGFTAAASDGSSDLNPSGIIGGIEAGYNFQLSPSFVAGIEADLQGSGISGTGGAAGAASYGPDVFGLTDTATGQVQVTSGIDWLGTVRARMGYLATPTVLVFATGGLAYGGVTATQSASLSFSDDQPFSYPTFGGTTSSAATRVGWTAGGGAEWTLMPGWSVKAEALYYNLGSATFSGSPVGALDPAGSALTGGSAGSVMFSNATATRITYDGVIVRGGINYHFNAGAPVTEAASASAASWAGFYGGLNAGYGWGTSNSADTQAVPVVDNLTSDLFWLTPAGFTAAANTGSASLSSSGFVGGAQAGYNMQWSQLVAGIEADIQGSGMRGHGSYVGVAQYGPDISGFVDTATGSGSGTASIDWLGTVRARAGYLATPGLLIYATGGLAYGGVSASTSHAVAFRDDGPSLYPTFGGTTASAATRVGWTVGGGGEWQLASRWSVKAEALYFDLGTETFTGSPVGATDPDGNALVVAQAGATMFANIPVTRVTYDGVIVRAGVNYRFN